MAVTVFGAGTMVTSAGTALSPAPPASTQADDIAIISIWSDESASAYTITAPWQPVGTKDGVSSGAFQGASYWLRSTGTVPTPSITKAGSAQWGAVCVVYRGVRTIGAPWSVDPTYSANASDTSIEASTITPYFDGSRIVMVGFHSVDSGSAQLSSWSVTSPGTLTEDTDQSTSSGTGGGIGSASANQTTAGATGAGAATIASASLSVGLLFDLVPESAMTVTRGKQFTGLNASSIATVTATVPSGGIAIGSKLVIGVSIGNASQTVTIADNAASTNNTYTQVQRSTSALSSVELAVFYCDVTTALAAADVITATTSGNSFKAIAVYELIGAASGAHDAVSSAVDVAGSTGSTVDPGSVTTSVNGDAIFVFCASTGSPSIQFPSANYSNELGAASTSTIRTIDFETRISNASGTEDPATLTWSGTSVAIVAFTTAFKPAAGATPVDLPLAAASATGTASLALTAPTQIPFNAASAAASATLALTAPTQIPLGAASATCTATLSLTVPSSQLGLGRLGVMPLGASLEVVAPVTLPLAAASAVASASLALTAPTQIPLNACSAVATGSLALTAPTQIPLNAASAVASGSLGLTAQTLVALNAASAVSGATLALTAPTTIALNAASATSSATLALTAPTRVPLNASSATATASLAVTAPTTIPLNASSAVGSGSLALTAPTQLPLNAASAVCTATLALTAPSVSATSQLGLLQLGIAQLPGGIGVLLPLSPATAASSASCRVSKTILGTATGGINAALIAANDGDTVALATGTYALETITAVKTIDTYLTRVAAATVTIAGMIHTGSAHVYMRDMTFDSGSTAVAAIQVNDLTTDLTLDGLTTTGSKYSVRVGNGGLTPANWATRVTVENCDLSGANVDLIQVNGANDLLVQRNLIHDVDTSSGLHDDGIQIIAADGTIIRRNHFYFTTPQAVGPNQAIICGRSSNLNGIQEVTDTRIENNLINNWPGTGLTISGVTNMVIVNNTVYDSGLTGTNGTLAVSGVDSSGDYANVNVTLANNIIENMMVVNGAVRPDIETNNLVRTGGGGTNLITSDPLFTGVTGVSAYSLSSGSPAINAADPAYAPTDDYDGVVRGGSPDMGAREFISGAVTIGMYMSASGSASLALTAPTKLSLNAASAVSSATLSLSIPGSLPHSRTLLGAGI